MDRALVTQASAQPAKLNVQIPHPTVVTAFSLARQPAALLAYPGKIPPNQSFFSIATNSIDFGHTLQRGGEKPVVSVIVFIKYDFFANAKACTRRLKACFLEAAVQKKS